MQKQQLENEKIIEAYEANTQKRAEQTETNIQAVLTALQPIIETNLAYLKYAGAKGYFIMEPKLAENTALHTALVSVLGRSIRWSVQDARNLAFEILEEVNDHEMAAKVLRLLMRTRAKSGRKS